MDCLEDATIEHSVFDNDKLLCSMGSVKLIYKSAVTSSFSMASIEIRNLRETFKLLRAFHFSFEIMDSRGGCGSGVFGDEAVPKNNAGIHITQP